MAALTDYNKEELMAIVAGLAEGKTIVDVESYIVPNQKALAVDAMHYLLCNESHAPGSPCPYYPEQGGEAYPWKLEAHRKWLALYDSIFGETTPLIAQGILRTFGTLIMSLDEEAAKIIICLIKEKYSLTD